MSSLLHVTAGELVFVAVSAVAVVLFFVYVVLPGDESLRRALAQESDHHG